MASWVPVGKQSEFREGRGRAVKFGERTIAVFRVGERWFAIQDACPHMGASLADGKLHGLEVVCHWHGWKFDLESGQGDQRQWACAEVFACRLEGDELLVREPDPPPEPDDAGTDDDEWLLWDPERYFKRKS